MAWSRPFYFVGNKQTWSLSNYFVHNRDLVISVNELSSKFTDFAQIAKAETLHYVSLIYEIKWDQQ